MIHLLKNGYLLDFPVMWMHIQVIREIIFAAQAYNSGGPEGMDALKYGIYPKMELTQKLV